MPVTDHRGATGRAQVVPVIDIGGFGRDADADARLAAEVDAACRQIGFLLVTGHGVDDQLIDQMYEVSHRVSSLPTEATARWASPTGTTYRGWSVRQAMTTEAGRQPAREMLEVGRYDGAEDLRPAWQAYYAALEDLGCDVEAVPGSLVVNLGDMLARWTNDRWVATEHQVVNPGRDVAGTARVSIPFFQHPDLDAPIACIPTCTGPDDPPRYETVPGGDWAAYRMSDYLA